MENLTILTYALPYLGLGIFVTIISDISIRELKTGEPFTFFEILACIVIWPFILYQLVKGFFDGE